MKCPNGPRRTIEIEKSQMEWSRLLRQEHAKAIHNWSEVAPRLVKAFKKSCTEDLCKLKIASRIAHSPFFACRGWHATPLEAPWTATTCLG